MSGAVVGASVLAAAGGVFALAAAATAAGSRLVPPAVAGGPTVSRRSRPPLWWALGASDRSRRAIAALLKEASVQRTPEEMIGLKRAAIAGALMLAMVVPGVGPMLVPPILMVGFRGPEIVLRRLAKRRTRAAARELPLFLDLLAVATNAGLAPQLAVRLAVEPVTGTLADELRRASRDADLGRRWRDELLAAAERTRLPDLQRAVRLLVRTELLGSSLADEMARLAADVRETRRARATERARAAPVKMLFPLVFLILPAFLLLTVMPVLLTTVGSIG